MAVDYSLFGGAESLSEGRKPASDASNQGRSPRRVYAAGEGERPDLHAHQKPPMDPKDFLWLMTEEPHRSRRMAIMKAHPEVTKLMGHEPLTKWVVLGVVSLQISLAIYLPPYFTILLVFQGVDGIDTDLPTKVELMFLNNVLGKVFFATFQILFYALRPTFVRVQKFTQWHALNVLVQAVSTPVPGHFIAEHYLWDATTGPLNVLAYNVGYHNEHHDFPSVPWTRLPALRAMAPEFYDNIPNHPSVADEVGIYARAKRLAKGAKTCTDSEDVKSK
ncbi:dihydroceramide delta(4)-desaturase [Coprinopsis sp. MPI-PUGE-AT-0042]|nr:dihydroceramide delta(4)-desaturase [Coprinopsis sp. MPI-PUGE-AT-0042]